MANIAYNLRQFVWLDRRRSNRPRRRRHNFRRLFAWLAMLLRVWNEAFTATAADSEYEGTLA